MLRIFFCENGSESDTLVALASISDWSRVDLAERVAVPRRLRIRSAALPERAAQLALTGRFVYEFSGMVGRWAAWATATVERWPDDPLLAEPERRVFEEIARIDIQAPNKLIQEGPRIWGP